MLGLSLCMRKKIEYPPLGLTCVSLMLNVFEPVFTRNLFQKGYVGTLSLDTRT